MRIYLYILLLLGAAIGAGVIRFHQWAVARRNRILVERRLNDYMIAYRRGGNRTIGGDR